MSRRRGRGNPKKDPAARRRRPAVRPTPARREIPKWLRSEVLLAALQDKDAHAAPIFLAAGLWMFSAAGHPANHCIDACMTLGHAYSHFGIASRVELLQVQVAGNGGPTVHGAEQPHWNPDGTFDGHAVLYLPEPRDLVDPTVAQFPEVPADSLVGRVVPVVIPLPEDIRFDGQDSIALARNDHTVTYLPAAGDTTELLSHPVLQQAGPGYRQTWSCPGLVDT